MSLDWKYIIDDLLGSGTICKKIQGLKENPKESHREKIDSCKKILTADWKFNIDDLLNSDVSYDNLFSSIEYKYTSMNIKSILNNTCQKTEDIYVEAQKYKDVDNEKRHQLLLYAAECGISKAYLDIANELIDDKNVNSNSYNRQKRWIDAAIREGETSICRYLHRLEYTYNHNTNMERDKSYYRKLIFSGLDKSMLRGLENENIFAIQKFYDYLDIVDKKLFIEEKYYNCYIGRLKIGILTRLLQYDKNNNDYMLKLAQIYLTVFEDYLSYLNWIDKAIENGNICASVNKMLNADRKYLTVESHTYEDNIFQEIALWYSASAEEYYDPNEAFNYGMSIRKTSPKEAHDLLLYASECGLTKAYYYVGMNYGSGIDKDIFYSIK